MSLFILQWSMHCCLCLMVSHYCVLCVAVWFQTKLTPWQYQPTNHLHQCIPTYVQPIASMMLWWSMLWFCVPVYVIFYLISENKLDLFLHPDLHVSCIYFSKYIKNFIKFWNSNCLMKHTSDATKSTFKFVSWKLCEIRYDINPKLNYMFSFLCNSTCDQSLLIFNDKCHAGLSGIIAENTFLIILGKIQNLVLAFPVNL